MVPKFNVTPELVARFAEMFDIPMSKQDLAEMPAQLAGGFSGIADLWRVDVTGYEPATILPVEWSAEK